VNRWRVWAGRCQEFFLTEAIGRYVGGLTAGEARKKKVSEARERDCHNSRGREGRFEKSKERRALKNEDVLEGGASCMCRGGGGVAHMMDEGEKTWCLLKQKEGGVDGGVVGYKIRNTAKPRQRVWGGMWLRKKAREKELVKKKKRWPGNCPYSST